MRKHVRGYPCWSGAKQLQSETGYIDARPLTPDRRKPLATRGRTIHPGQKAKYSLRAHIVRFAPESGLKSDLAGGPFRASSGSRLASFDHLVGAGQQRRGDNETDGLSRLEVDDEFEFGRLLDRQI